MPLHPDYIPISTLVSQSQSGKPAFMQGVPLAGFPMAAAAMNDSSGDDSGGDDAGSSSAPAADPTNPLALLPPGAAKQIASNSALYQGLFNQANTDYQQNHVTPGERMDARNSQALNTLLGGLSQSAAGIGNFKGQASTTTTPETMAGLNQVSAQNISDRDAATKNALATMGAATNEGMKSAQMQYMYSKIDPATAKILQQRATSMNLGDIDFANWTNAQLSSSKIAAALLAGGNGRLMTQPDPKTGAPHYVQSGPLGNIDKGPVWKDKDSFTDPNGVQYQRDPTTNSFMQIHIGSPSGNPPAQPINDQIPPGAQPLPARSVDARAQTNPLVPNANVLPGETPKSRDARVAQAQKDVGRLDDLDKEVDPANVRYTSGYTVNDVLNKANAAEGILEQAKTQIDGLDKRQTVELAIAINATLGGSTAISGIDEFIPVTSRGNIAEIEEKIRGIPKGLQQQAFTARMAETLANEQRRAQDFLHDKQLRIFGTKQDLAQTYPEKFAQSLKAQGMSPDEFNNFVAGKPKTPYGQKGGPMTGVSGKSTGLANMKTMKAEELP